MNDLVKLYNPANAELLTPEQLEGLQKLDSNQIKELAKAYPNSAIPRAYLLIVDSTKPVEKQLPSLSTFENLWNLREKNAQKQYVPFAFKGTFKPKSVSTVKPRKAEVLDLSDVELMSLPGFKKNGVKEDMPETVQVKKIRKVPAERQKQIAKEHLETFTSPDVPLTDIKKPVKKAAKKTKSK